MEEDIKVLEEKLKQWEPYKNVKWETPIEKEIARENKAIENLIKGYKELEEKQKNRTEHSKEAYNKYYKKNREKRLQYYKKYYKKRKELLQEGDDK